MVVLLSVIGGGVAYAQQGACQQATVSPPREGISEKDPQARRAAIATAEVSRCSDKAAYDLVVIRTADNVIVTRDIFRAFEVRDSYRLITDEVLEPCRPLKLDEPGRLYHAELRLPDGTFRAASTPAVLNC